MVGKPSLFCEDLGRHIDDPFLFAISRGEFCEHNWFRGEQLVKNNMPAHPFKDRKHNYQEEAIQCSSKYREIYISQYKYNYISQYKYKYISQYKYKYISQYKYKYISQYKYKYHNSSLTWNKNA